VEIRKERSPVEAMAEILATAMVVALALAVGFTIKSMRRFMESKD
jgi:hypothetical protein